MTNWNPITRLRNRLTTDGPGHSGYPRADIAAHRSMARTMQVGSVIAAISIFVAFYVGPYTDPTGPAVTALLIVVMGYAIGGSFRLEALEWEVELLKERDNHD